MLSLSPKKPLSVILEATAGLVSPPASSPDSQTPGYNLVCNDTGASEESVQDSWGNYLSKVKNSLKTKAERERERKKKTHQNANSDCLDNGIIDNLLVSLFLWF